MLVYKTRGWVLLKLIKRMLFCNCMSDASTMPIDFIP